MTQKNELFVFTSAKPDYRLLKASDFDDYLLHAGDAQGSTQKHHNLNIGRI